MKLFPKLRLDTQALEQGAWHTHPTGFEIRIRRSSWPPYLAGIRRLAGELRATAGGGEIPVEEQSMAYRQLVAEHLVTDWRGVVAESPGGGEPKEVPFSRELLKELFADPAYAPLYTWVFERASDDAGFRELATQRTLGKSNAASSGGSGTGST